MAIGRQPGIEIVIPDDREVSKKHAWIGVVDGRLLLRDLNSTNGTFLNDDINNPIKECEVHEGDTIVLGRHNGLKFRLLLD